MNFKNFLTIDNQIKKISRLGIAISNNDKTKKLLLENSFYNIFNGYRQPFEYLKQSNNYIKGTSFDEIFALYDFDKKIRNTLFPYLLDIENLIKTEVLYEFGSTVDGDGILSHDGDGYLKISNYEASITNSKNQIKNTLSLISEIHNIISKSFQYSKSINHYLINYGYVPLWVIGTQMTFGTVSKFYQCMKSSNRQSISKKYNMPDNSFQSILKLLTTARNHCAHYNRIYCIDIKLTLPTPNKSFYPIAYNFINSRQSSSNLFSIIIAMKYFLKKKNYTSFINIIQTHIKALEMKLKVIPIDNIMSTMGFPNNWIDIKK
jgi:abortive infection bacteriophage resistance protein